MRKRNSEKGKKEALKLALAGGIAICFFGTGFLAVNHSVTAVNYNKPVKLQKPVQAEQSPKTKPSEKTQSAGYKKADYKLVTDPKNTCSNTNAISASKAAEIGARYLWDVYGTDLSGGTIYMMYIMDSSKGIGYWIGDVVKKGGSKNEPSYSFDIEAVSGERASIRRNDTNAVTKKTMPYKEGETEEYYKTNSEKFLEKAKEYAKIQLPDKPVKAEFKGVGALIAPGYEFEIPKDKATMVAAGGQASDTIMVPLGEEIPATYIYVSVLVTDAAGNQAELNIDVSDYSLAFMINVYNGVVYDPNSVG